MSASKSSALRTISSARERPTRRGSHSSAPPPGTSPTPTSGLPNRALWRLAKRMSQASTNSLPMPRVRPRILAMLTTGMDERRSTMSRQRSSTSGRSAALATSRWAMKKSGFADWNTATLTDGSASRSYGQNTRAMWRLADPYGACAGGYHELSVMRDRFHWARLLAFVTGLVNHELLLRNEYLVAENRILRARLSSRLR